MTEGPADERVAAMRSQYREMVVAWAEASDDPKKANRIFKKLHVLYKSMRASAEGQSAIGALVDDPITAVRMTAAAHSLAWQPARSEQVLEEIEQENNLYAIDAKWTLRSYRSGKLDLDW